MMARARRDFDTGMSLVNEAESSLEMVEHCSSPTIRNE
jgi:hypothetical protein